MDRLGGFFGSRDAEDHLDDDFVEEADADLDPPPSPVGQDERRMQVRAYNHWASLLGDAHFPHIDDLEPETLDDFGPFSVLLDLSGNIEDPQVRFVGSELREECTLEGELSQLSAVPSRSVLSRITDHYMQILANQAPIGFEAEFVNDRDITVLYRGILLPYSSDDTTIDYIYGVINWKEMADQQTADALLLAIDQALGGTGDDGGDCEIAEIETAETLTERLSDDWNDDVLELGNEDMMDNSSPSSLPQPAFGQVDDEDDSFIAPPSGIRVDALGNPVGGYAAYDDGEAEEIEYDNAIKTAADYGLPDWDEEDYEEDDVDGVVDPLADEDTSSSLMSLVSRGLRGKKAVDLSSTEPAPPIPQAYEGEPVSLAPIPSTYEAQEEADYASETDAAEPFGEEAFDLAAELVPDETDGEPATTEPAPSGEEDVAFDLDEEFAVAEEPAEEEIEIRAETEADNEPALAQDYSEDEVAPVEDEVAPEGLYDCLAAAREMAQTAQNTEDRSRKALYTAVARAYDFSLEAQANPRDYDELLVDNGLTFQDRAPMTPIVKLVFGTEYDKTRLTEYAAVLTYAHRVGVERGTLGTFLREAEGGLKGVVNAERRARKEEQGKEVADDKAVRPNLARKLRKLEALSLADLDEDGAEFALVMVRRTPEGELVVLGEVPEDIQLVERAARKLLG